MRHLSLFTGVGGGDLAHQHLLGWQTVGYVEFDKFCQQVLAQRIQDGFLHKAPIFGDIDGFIESGASKKYKGYIDVLTAGFPCQPFSVAGKRRLDDPRNKWPQTIQCIRDVRPRRAFLENVPGLLNSGYFGEILTSLAEAGFDARWIVLGADDVGAPHRRKRLWILADSNGDDGWTGGSTVAPGRRSRVEHRSGSAGQSGRRSGEDVADFGEQRLQGSIRGGQTRKEKSPGGYVAQCGEDVADTNSERGCLRETNGQDAKDVGQSPRRSEYGSWDAEPDVGRVVDGVAHRVDRLRAIGNGQVSRVAALAWRVLNESYPKKP